MTRALAIHGVTPYKNHSDDPESEGTDMTDAEVTTMIEGWYDTIVSNNS